MAKFIDDIRVKSTLLVVLPLIMTFVDNVTGDWIINNKIVDILGSYKKFVVIIAIIYIFIVISYAYREHGNKKSELEYNYIINMNKKTINAYKKEISLLTAIFDQTQDSINKLTRVFRSTKKLDLREWDFESIATPVCKGIYETVLTIAEVGDKFSVSIYIKNSYKSDGKMIENVRMIAHEGEHKYEPKILGVNKLIVTNSEYLYAKQFINNNPKRTILPDRDDIKRAFKFNGDYENYKEEYGQYIGIPIICKGNTMIALIEIVAHEGSKIAITKDNIEDLINKYILPYQYFLLMSHKIERNMKTTIEIINKEGVTDGEK